MDISLNYKHLRSAAWDHKIILKHKRINIQNKDGENVSSLEVVEVVLVQHNLVDIQYQQKSEVLYTFTHNESYAYLLNVEPRNLVFWKLITQNLLKLS